MVHNEIFDFIIIIIILFNKRLVSMGEEQVFFKLALSFFNFLFEQDGILSCCDVDSSLVIALVVVFYVFVSFQW